MMLTKTELRKNLRAARQTMSEAERLRKSELLCEKVLQTPAYQEASTVYGYLPFRQEVELTPLLRQAQKDGKTVALPKCFGPRMVFIRMEDMSLVGANPMGVPEPLADGPVDDDPYALVILPGLAFDSRGYRVGYGGGYYDRFLAREKEHPTIALCFDFQLLDAVPADPHDIPADIVLWV